MSELLQTALFETHVAMGAKMVNFAGYSMPVSYSTIREEHRAVRENVGLFDVGHMGVLCLTGQGTKGFLSEYTLGDVSRLKNGQVQYTGAQNEVGGLIDDLLVYRLKETEFLVVSNASNKEKILQWFTEKSQGFELKIKALWPSHSLIAVQGPKAMMLMQTLDFDLDKLQSFFVEEHQFDGEKIWISRTGYTGEDGVEICCPVEIADVLWQKLLQRGEVLGVRACGLGSRDVLRLEAGLSLYGQDLDENRGPHECGIGWVVDDKKACFAKDQVQQKRLQGGKTMAIEVLTKGIPRSGYELQLGEQIVGRVTSGGQSLSLGKSIALVYIFAEHKSKISLGQELNLLVRGKSVPVKVISRRFLRS